MRGLLIAFEGLDQSGKQTQAERLRDRLTTSGRRVRLLSFPDYSTSIGSEIGLALRGERPVRRGADATAVRGEPLRVERRRSSASARRGRSSCAIAMSPRASPTARRKASTPSGWPSIQKHLPPADLTFLLDIAPEVSARRKRTDRDKYERDLGLLARVRDSYIRQAANGWVPLDADRDRGEVAADVYAAVSARL